MANTIKLKTGSGSDPSASDLIVGEIAIRTDNGKLFTKKDNGSVAEISGGGGGIDDGDKGDITVSNGGDTFTIDDGVITSAKIADGAIVNADINASAAIAGTKISPDFGSQDIVTTGNIDLSNSTGSGNNRIKIGANDEIEIFRSGTESVIVETQGNNLDLAGNRVNLLNQGRTEVMLVAIANGGVELYHNNNKKFETSSSGGILTGNLDVSSGLDVTGNITVSGTVDGRDLATDGSKLDGIAAGATNVTNTNQLTNGAGFITATLTNEEVQDIVGGMVVSNTESGITVQYSDSAGKLNFTVASQTDNNFTDSDHSKLDGIESGATADQTASEILTLIKTVDGAGSGLDADTLDGISSASFVRSDADDTLNGQYTISDSANEKLVLAGSSSPYIRFQEGTTDKGYIQWNSAGYLRLVNQEDSSQLRIQDDIKFSQDGSTFYKVWHENNDGSGSGLDADTLDGVEGSNYAQKSGATCSGDFTFQGGAGAVSIDANSDIRLSNGSWTGDFAGKIQHHSNYLYIQGGTGTYGILFRDHDGTNRWAFRDSGHLVPYNDSTYDIGLSGTRVRNIYADTLYGSGANLTNLPSQTDQNFTTTLKNKLDGIASGATNVTNNNQISNGAGYITSADGGNAATLDGIDSSQFLRSDTGDTASGDITFSGGAYAVSINAGSDIRLASGNWTGNHYGKIQHHNSFLYISGGQDGIIFRENDTNRWKIDGSGHFDPGADSTYDIGQSDVRVRNGYFDTLYGDGSNLTGISAGLSEDTGSWTPTVTFGGGSSGQSYSIRVGRYVKIGSLVHIQCHVEFSDKGNSSGTAKIAGLPFTIRNATNDFPSAVMAFKDHGSSSSGPGSISSFMVFGDPNNTTLDIAREQLNDSTSEMNDATNGNFADNTQFMLTMTYVAA